ncbi:unnamed protein product [Jaminaea pallidilutea]
MLTKECIPWRVDERSSHPQQSRDREHAQACPASPPATAFDEASSHTAPSSAMQDALDDLSFFRPFAKADRPSAYPGLNASDTMLKNFLPTASTFLLRHKAFASNIEAAADAISASDQLLAVMEEISMQVAEAKLELLYLFFPDLPALTDVVTKHRVEPDTSTCLLLATMLRLALSHDDSRQSLLISTIRKMIEVILLDSTEGDDLFAPHALELLFCYLPLSLGRKPKGKNHCADARPATLGMDLLVAARRLSDPARIAAVHRLYIPLMSDEDLITANNLHSLADVSATGVGEGYPGPIGAASSSVLRSIGHVGYQHRLQVIHLIRDSEHKVLTISSAIGRPEPTEALADALRRVVDDVVQQCDNQRAAFNTAIRNITQGGPLIFAAKKLWIAYFEGFTLSLISTFASNVTAVHFRIGASTTVDQAFIAQAVQDSRPRISELTAFLGTLRFSCHERILALQPSLTEFTDLQWILPNVERSAFLAAATMSALQDMGGRIFFSKRKPDKLDSMIILLEAAGSSLTAANDQESARAVCWGNTVVTCGVLAKTAASVMKQWRDRLLERSLQPLQPYHVREPTQTHELSETHQETDALYAPATLDFDLGDDAQRQFEQIFADFIATADV